MRALRWVAVGLVVLVGVSLTGPAAGTVSAPVPEPAGWRVEPVAQGYRVVLRLAAPLRMRDAVPLLAADGRILGPARESVDRRTVSLVTTDPRVLRARDVRLVHSAAELSSATGRSVAKGTDWSGAQRGPVLPVDPGSTGKHQVDTADYDLGDQAVFLPGLKQKSELRGKVYSPRGGEGARPVIVFLHGRHSVCYGPSPDPGPGQPPWPCPRGNKAIPSYHGYDAPARALASHGYHVVSISANAINAWDSEVFDAGATARGQLVLAHLDLWQDWSTSATGPFAGRFVGRIDLDNVGLMGHSRGGDGVVKAALLNAERPTPYGVRAVLPLAPTAFARPTLPGVAMSVILPYCDGDVADLQGQHFYDDTRHATADQAPRSTVLVMGANHNFFNTEWTPGQAVAPAWDDWWTEDDRVAPCGSKQPQRLKATEQQAVGRAYIAGFFRLSIGGEKALLPLLDGSDSRAASAGRAIVRVVAQAPAATRLDLARFDRALPAGSVSGVLSAQVCAGVPLEDGSVGGGRLPACENTQAWDQTPHWTPAWFAPKAETTAVTRLRWNGTSGVVRVAVPAERRDVRRFAALSFRVAPGLASTGRLDLTVRVVDGAGKHADVAVSSVSDALVPLPGDRRSTGLPKLMLRTVRIPLASLGQLDLADVRSVELRTNRVGSGTAFVSDLAFDQPSIGQSAPTRLPRLSIADLKMPEGNRAGRADFSITLSAASPVPVTVNVDTTGDFETYSAVRPVNRRITIPAGQTRATVALPIRANVRDSYDEEFQLVLSVPHDAVVADAFADGLVVDDDPTPRLFVGAGRAQEGTKRIRFPVGLSAVSDKHADIEAQLHNGTAEIGWDVKSLGDDGKPPVERWVETPIMAGTRTGYLEADVVDDWKRERTETFRLRITRVHDASYPGPAVLTGTVLDNDS